MTNMPQPEDPDFVDIISEWWTELNLRVPLSTELYSGTDHPVFDWSSQSEPEITWYYGLDRYSLDEVENFCILGQYMRGIEHLAVTTALDLTCTIDPEITHDLIIPGVWLIKVIKNSGESTL